MEDPKLATREEVFDCLLTEDDRDLMAGLRISDREDTSDADMLRFQRYTIDNLKARVSRLSGARRHDAARLLTAHQRMDLWRLVAFAAVCVVVIGIATRWIG